MNTIPSAVYEFVVELAAEITNATLAEDDALSTIKGPPCFHALA